MFAWRGALGPVELAVTDRELDLVDSADRARLTEAFGLDALAWMRQVHGADVAAAAGPGEHSDVDALVADRPGLGLLVRVADCVPVVLAAPDDAQVAVAHAGRAGLVDGVVPAAVAALRSSGAHGPIHGWIGPHVCGRCYELPQDMADAVAAAVPAARSETSWGTPAADLGAGVAAQLEAEGATVHDIARCTLEDDTFFSHRRGDAGRFGAVVVVR